ncbi:carboxylic ester hydrolase, putative [Ricinus communis]|uniref:Carboxylic ester hydrolase, putative n=1 Tax=Ricinus communis TaxID=3988 RepID=B9T6P9_RICCO|nr:carboxylic ester hydrolase, putative [Ricinus communis]
MICNYMYQEVYKIGGRKFGILSLQDLGFLPSLRALEHTNTLIGFREQVLVLVKLHNKALAKVLRELKKQLKGFKYSNFDVYSSASERVNNPSKYGFKEGKAACCGFGPYRGAGGCGGMGAIKEYELCDNPSEYLFFDGGHPTEKFNNQLAELMWSGNPKIISPYNIKTLVDA